MKLDDDFEKCPRVDDANAAGFDFFKLCPFTFDEAKVAKRAHDGEAFIVEYTSAKHGPRYLVRFDAITNYTAEERAWCKGIVNRAAQPVAQVREEPEVKAKAERPTVATGEKRKGGAKAICREVFDSLGDGRTKEAFVAGCEAKGVFAGTAKARWTDLCREAGVSPK